MYFLVELEIHINLFCGRGPVHRIEVKGPERPPRAVLSKALWLRRRLLFVLLHCLSPAAVRRSTMSLGTSEPDISAIRFNCET